MRDFEKEYKKISYLIFRKTIHKASVEAKQIIEHKEVNIRYFGY